MREITTAYEVLVAKLEGTRPLGQSRHRWENIKNGVKAQI
jgi:hypothetical protein